MSSAGRIFAASQKAGSGIATIPPRSDMNTVGVVAHASTRDTDRKSLSSNARRMHVIGAGRAS
jgi:hypothetical protein